MLASRHAESHVSYLQTMALNMTTPTELLSLFLPLIKREHVRLSDERRASKYGLSGIINVSSLGAFMPIPSMALYAATKVSTSAPKGQTYATHPMGLTILARFSHAGVSLVILRIHLSGAAKHRLRCAHRLHPSWRYRQRDLDKGECCA